MPKEYTEKQLTLLSNLPKCNFDPVEAAKQAGYANPYDVVRTMKKEIAEATQDLLTLQSLKAAKLMSDVLDGDKPMINLKEKIDVSKDILDRTGHAKRALMEVEHKVKGGVFILPDKKPTFIEGEYDEIVEDDFEGFEWNEEDN